ncbi:MAG: hypothetical protein ACRBEQ_03610 [Hyphomonas sp.]
MAIKHIRTGLAVLATASVLALAGCVHVGPVDEAAIAERAVASVPITDGQTIVMATHSFNLPVGPAWTDRTFSERRNDGPLQALADEAGKEGHETRAVQMIGGSTPMQHWNQGGGDDTKNIAKVALDEGGVEVFTLSPNRIMPEPGIDLLADYVIKTNPDARILVQNSWSGWDGEGMTPAVGGKMEDITFVNADRDATTDEMIEGWVTSLNAPNGYLEKLRTQLSGIDERAGKEITYVVPAAEAVYELRRRVIKGEVPGVETQSEMFRDAIGHANEPVINLITYTWFGVMYRQSPVGLTALENADDPTSAAREQLLQEIAWAAVLNEEKSGVTAD